MKFISTGKIENPKPGDDSMEYYTGKFHDLLDELQEKSDFVVVTINGKERFTSAVNYLGGVCDDCTEFHNSAIEKAEGFKKSE